MEKRHSRKGDGIVKNITRKIPKQKKRNPGFREPGNTLRNTGREIAVGAVAIGVLVGCVLLHEETEPELSIPEKPTEKLPEIHGRSRFGRGRNEKITGGAYRGYVPKKIAGWSDGIPEKERPCGTVEHSTRGE